MKESESSIVACFLDYACTFASLLAKHAPIAVTLARWRFFHRFLREASKTVGRRFVNLQAPDVS